MANGVVVCECGRIHWNNAAALKELYALITFGHVKDLQTYLRYKRQHEGWINRFLAVKRIKKLQELGLVMYIEGKLETPVQAIKQQA